MIYKYSSSSSSQDVQGDVLEGAWTDIVVPLVLGQTEENESFVDELGLALGGGPHQRGHGVHNHRVAILLELGEVDSLQGDLIEVVGLQKAQDLPFDGIAELFPASPDQAEGSDVGVVLVQQLNQTFLVSKRIVFIHKLDLGQGWKLTRVEKVPQELNVQSAVEVKLDQLKILVVQADLLVVGGVVVLEPQGAELSEGGQDLVEAEVIDVLGD